jgi:KDO2-lipid IV(A) lauroyltransferase
VFLLSDSTTSGIDARAFLAPRYWPLWLGFGLLRLLILLPYRWQLALGGLLGRLMYLAIPRRRHIAETNIRLCFPDLNEEERDAVVRKHFRAVGISVFEIGLCWWGSEAKLRPLCHIEGLKHLDTARSQGKGVILFSAHFTCLEIGGRLLAQHTPFFVMYKYHRNPLFEAVMRDGRERRFLGAIERSDVRGMLRTLKAGHACWYALDQDFGTVNAVFAPFFGIPAATLTSTSRIAKMTGAALVPFFVHRLEDDSGYQLTLLPALEKFPSGDDQADATLTNHLIETQVRKAPAQYLWMHRRFKSRPKGEADVYER